MRITILFVACFLIGDFAYGQYFGRNKPRYQNFDFKVEETQHFRIHHYLKNEEVIKQLASWSEQWYENHKRVFGEPLLKKNPIIFYNDHPDFQQTNTISGMIGVGTGGVTEALKNRVVMPIGFSNQSTHHVLAHELVHAFHFSTLINNDTTGLNNLMNLPLWMIEGMAEYYSLGRIDPFTAMWMRDAILRNDLPDINQMRDFKYFPYRYGHSLMAFIGSFFGDDKIQPLYMESAKFGVDAAMQIVLGADSKTVASLWHQALKRHYEPFLGDKKEKVPGRKLISRENSGRINVSPSISPNGRWIIYLSEKDVFSTDLYLADAQTGNIERKITSLSGSGDLDFINVLESSGAWSPNGKDFVFVGVRRGDNVLVIKDAESGRTLETLSIPGVPAFVNPVYHPNGREIIVTGLVNGQVDFYSFDIKNKRVRQLTFDLFSENMPDISTDGLRMVFSYDRKSYEQGRINGRFTYDIAEMDLPTGQIRILPFFHGADNLNPKYDAEGNIWFVSDRDGFRNLYKYDRSTQKVFKMTNLLTGLSGIANASPMISVSAKRDKIIYTHYYNSEYTIYQANMKDLVPEEVMDVNEIDLSAGTLPVVGLGRMDIVGESFTNVDNYTRLNRGDYRRVPYRPNFRLDYIGGGLGAGVGVNNNTFRNAMGLQGGVDMLFSDLLGNNTIYSMLAMNGEILDFGGMVSYINRKNRLAWGVGLSHIPIRFGFQDFTNTNVQINEQIVPAIKSTVNLIRIFDQSANIFAHYPFSTTLRLEGGIAGTYRSFRWDEYNDYFVGNQISGYFLVGNDRQRVETGDELIVDEFYTIRRGSGANANIALVGDNSFFGLTAPLAGHRFRISAERYVGNDRYNAFLADFRKYFWAKPFSFAFRTTAFMRFEEEVNSVYPIYIGNMGFVRGLGSIISADVVRRAGYEFAQLLGSKMGLGSFEVRLPFTGPRQLALISSNAFFSDLNLFVDAGVAFDQFQDFSDGKFISAVRRDPSGNIVLDESGRPIFDIINVKPAIATTAGVSLRINLFGALVLEPYYAWHLNRGGVRTFGMNLIPGW